MGKSELFVLIIILIAVFSPVVYAVEANIPSVNGVPQTAQAQIDALLKAAGPTVYQVSQSDIDIAEEKLMTGLKAYSDEQFMSFDQQMKIYMSQYRQKIIIAVIGINAFIAGVVFYYLSNQNRKMSYESAALRRQRGEDERQFVIKNMNFIRDRLENMQDINSKIFDSYVIPMQKFMQAEQVEKAKKAREEAIRAEEERRYREEYDRWQRETQQYDQEYGQQGTYVDRGFVGGGDYGGSEDSQYGTEYDQAGFPVARGPDEDYEGNY